MNKNSVKYMHSVNFSQLPTGDKTEVENLGLAATVLVTSKSLWSRIQNLSAKI
jgi:hypothetical protein